MLEKLAQRFASNPDLRSHFYLGEILLGILFLGILWLLRPKGSESGFRVRESDLKKTSKKAGVGDDSLAQSKIRRNEPMRLEGIRIDGAPNEILGVPITASSEQVQKAYRDLMKRYHPDKVGAPGSREWKDAQKIAEAINRAKDELLKKNSGGKKF